MHRNRTSQLHGRTRLNQTASKRNLHKKAAQNAALECFGVFVLLSCRRPQNLDCPLRMLRLEHAAAGNEYVRSRGDNLFRIVFSDAAVEFDQELPVSSQRFEFGQFG